MRQGSIGAPILFSYDSGGRAGVSRIKQEYLNLTYVKPGNGVRFLTTRMIRGKGAKPRNVAYPKDGDPCTEPGFKLYVAGRRKELRIMVPFGSERRLRRFLRDFVKSQGGAVWSTNYWRTPWR